ncbi:Eukaryotic elongation factor 2 kinase [Symbiodinium microadriaticum]|uniref:Eukaryotic elongation factor 2 kinase n=1 Tax=Symbiodinium microadriaticum TaxID=2951 RepID=A0A1Q9DW48_SYMMI|nr:Eukaryotic elongation factor 2 kinase [Symbiodinium microadriaticum]
MFQLSQSWERETEVTDIEDIALGTEFAMEARAAATYIATVDRTLSRYADAGRIDKCAILNITNLPRIETREEARETTNLRSLIDERSIDLKDFVYGGEEFVSGEFVKLTSNAGFVNREEYANGFFASRAVDFPVAGLTVFGGLVRRMEGALLVSDIQGVCAGHRDDGREGRKARGGKDENRSWVLSDPQVLTDGAQYQFGRGDLGIKGMQMFFKSHKKSWLCEALGLKDISRIKEPTARLYFPGEKAGFLHGGRISDLLQERAFAYDEWLMSSIFSTTKEQANGS